ncbi:MAG: ATPase [Candidatus Peribacteria bacterium]|nr:ATPase [Candidatus Peribacteria bacterium]
MATKTLHITRIFNAPRETVWKAFTESEQIMKWWGPKDFTSPSARVDLRVGGTYLFCMHGPAGTQFDKDMWSTGTYKEIIPLEKIVATDNFSDEHGTIISPEDYGMPGEWPEQMIVTFVFEDAGKGKTKLTLTHTGHPEEMAHLAEAGWNQSLDKFAAILN